MAGDAIQVASENYKVLLENDRTRLLEYRDQPGNKTAMHSHPDVLAYAISGGQFKFTMSNGQAMDVEMKAGDSMFMEGHSHSTENVGSTGAHVLLVELK